MVEVKRIPNIDGTLGWVSISEESFLSIKEAKGRVECDYLIIGAGFAGLSAAAHLSKLKPESKIILIDALRVGEGTSGRNAGFIIDLPHNVDDLSGGIETDRRIMELNKSAISFFKNKVIENKIECQWSESGKYLLSSNLKNKHLVDDFCRKLDQLKEPYDKLTGYDLSSRIGTSYYKSGIYTPGNILMNPAALAMGLKRSLPDNVTVYENSPIISIQYSNKKMAKTLNSEIFFKNVIFTVNSFESEFNLSGRFFPIFTFASLTRRLSDAEFDSLGENIKPWGGTSIHPAGTTLRITNDRRVFIRNSYIRARALSIDKSDLEKYKKSHIKSMTVRFPQFRNVSFDYTWGGMLCMSRNFRHFFGELKKGVYAAVGMNGVGVAKASYLGRLIAEEACNIDSDDLRFVKKLSGPSWIPPDPFLTLGVNARLRYEEWRCSIEK